MNVKDLKKLLEDCNDDTEVNFWLLDSDQNGEEQIEPLISLGWDNPQALGGAKWLNISYTVR
jgi:hypothetical protein